MNQASIPAMRDRPVSKSLQKLCPSCGKGRTWLFPDKFHVQCAFCGYMTTRRHHSKMGVVR